MGEWRRGRRGRTESESRPPHAATTSAFLGSPPKNPTVPRHHCPPAHGGLGYPFVVIMLWGTCVSLQQGALTCIAFSHLYVVLTSRERKAHE